MRASEGVSGDERGECFLCNNPLAQKDNEMLILYRGANSYVLMNRFPYNSGHLMVAPYGHGASLAALTGETLQELWRLVMRGAEILSEEYQPDGFNIGMNIGVAAGAGVPDHLHVHVVPRWNGDTNFMPVTAGTKVLPESLDQTYHRLKPRFSVA